MLVQNQGRTFNRTSRRKIPLDCLSVELVEEDDNVMLKITSLKPDKWVESIPTFDRNNAELHIDISSRMFNERRTFKDIQSVTSPEWNGLDLLLPEGILSGMHNISVSVTVSLEHEVKDGGLILAQSAKMTLAPGNQIEKSGKTGALLIVPHDSVISELWKLDLDGTPEFPVVLLNYSLKDCWREIKEQPLFKYGILPSVLREIYFDIAINQSNPKNWAETWLSFKGAQGLKDSMPNIKENESDLEINDISEIRAWAGNVAESISSILDVYTKFEKEWESLKADES